MTGCIPITILNMHLYSNRFITYSNSTTICSAVYVLAVLVFKKQGPCKPVSLSNEVFNDSINHTCSKYMCLITCYLVIMFGMGFPNGLCAYAYAHMKCTGMKFHCIPSRITSTLTIRIVSIRYKLWY